MQKGKKFRWYHALIGVFVLFLLAIGGCVGSVFLATQEPVNEANAFFEMLSDEENSPGVAYAETSMDFQTYTSQQDFAAFINAYPIVTEVEDLSFNSRSIATEDGMTVATLEGTLYAEDGETSPIAVQLVKENDEWKVLYFSLEPIEEVADEEV